MFSNNYFKHLKSNSTEGSSFFSKWKTRFRLGVKNWATGLQLSLQILSYNSYPSVQHHKTYLPRTCCLTITEYIMNGLYNLYKIFVHFSIGSFCKLKRFAYKCSREFRNWNKVSILRELELVKLRVTSFSHKQTLNLYIASRFELLWN